MAKENDDIEIPEEEDLEGLDDTTDWKAKADELQKKHREAGIRNRERTKSLKDKIADLEGKISNPPQKADEFGLLQKGYLRMAGITDDEEIELAKELHKKTGLDFDKLVDDDYFKTKLEALRTTKANANAVSNLPKGGGATGGGKDTLEYWKSVNPGSGPPTNIPKDKKMRVALMKSYLKDSEARRKFWNDPK